METKHQPPFQDQWAQEKVSTPSTRHQVDSPYSPTIISVPVLSSRVRSINCLLWSSDSFTTTTKQQHSQAIPFKGGAMYAESKSNLHCCSNMLYPDSVILVLSGCWNPPLKVTSWGVCNKTCGLVKQSVLLLETCHLGASRVRVAAVGFHHPPVASDHTSPTQQQRLRIAASPRHRAKRARAE